MALGNISHPNKDMKLKIKKDVGEAKEIYKVIVIYEDIMNDTPDFEVDFNLIVCLYA